MFTVTRRLRVNVGHVVKEQAKSITAIYTAGEGYVAASEDIDPSYNPLQFWKQHEQSLPANSQQE